MEEAQIAKKKKRERKRHEWERKLRYIRIISMHSVKGSGGFYTLLFLLLLSGGGKREVKPIVHSLLCCPFLPVAVLAVSFGISVLLL